MSNPNQPSQNPNQPPYNPNQPPPNPNQPHNPYSVPQAHMSPHPGYQQHGGDSTGGVIPYKNPHALIAYYLGIVALLPIIGLPFGIASLILGIMGLAKRKKNPQIKGSVHAWIGIAGGIFSLICGGVGLLAVVSAMFG